MSSSSPRFPLDRRDFLKTTGIALAGASVLPQTGLRGARRRRGGRDGHGPRRVERAALPLELRAFGAGTVPGEEGQDAPLRARLRRRGGLARRAGPDALHLPCERGSRHPRRRAAGRLGDRHGLPPGPLRRPLHVGARPGVRGHRGRRLQGQARLHGRDAGRVPARPRRGGGRAHTPRRGAVRRRRAAPHRLAHRPRGARPPPRRDHRRPHGLHRGDVDQPPRVRRRPAAALEPQPDPGDAEQRRRRLRLRQPQPRVRRGAAGAHGPGGARLERAPRAPFRDHHRRRRTSSSVWTARPRSRWTRGPTSP